MDNANVALENLTFRQASAQLDSILQALDSNTLELEDALAAYERGVALLRLLQTKLNTAQQTIDVLMGELVPTADDLTQDATLS